MNVGVLHFVRVFHCSFSFLLAFVAFWFIMFLLAVLFFFVNWIKSPTSLYLSQTLIFWIVFQLVFLFPQHTFDRPFQKVNFPQYKGNVQLLFNFIEALFPLFHFLPVLAPIEKFAYLVGDKSNVGQKIEILKVSIFFLFVPEYALCEIQPKCHWCEIRHKKHQCKNRTYQSSYIRKKLVHLIKRTSVCFLDWWFANHPTHVRITSYLICNGLEYIRNRHTSIYMVLSEW